VFSNAYAVYSVAFGSASAGQTLHVRYRAATVFDAGFGNVTLQAASLNGLPVTNAPPPPVTLLDPQRAGARFTFTFATQNGANYAVEFTPSLNGGSWQGLTNVLGTGATAVVADPAIAAGQRFYRVVR
jgi:hypothetical protein